MGTSACYALRRLVGPHRELADLAHERASRHAGTLFDLA